MIYFITYGNEPYREAREYCAKMAKKKGLADVVIQYGPEDIDKEFCEKNKEILSVKRGNGLWLWKPYFINKTLNSINDGDYVFYSDAGSCLIKPIKPIIDSMTDDIWVFSNPDIMEKQACKPELLDYMNCNAPEYSDTPQRAAGWIIIKKSERGCAFVTEWLRLCQINDYLNTETRYDSNPPKEFKYYIHQPEQSVLSLLSKEWKIKEHLDPSQWGRRWVSLYSEDIGYEASIICHRGRRPRFIALYYLICISPRKIGLFLFAFAGKVNAFLHKMKLKG